MVAENYRFLAPVQETKRLIDSGALGQDDDKTYSTWVSIAETLPHAGARERCRDPKTGGKLQSNPIHSGLAEGIGSAEMENLG